MPEDFLVNTDVGEIRGTIKHGDKLVVFSHGFGVRRDSRGLFTDITLALPRDYGYILFDYNRVEMDGYKEHVFLRGYSEQAVILSSVLDYAREYSKDISIIGHSVGCMTISLVADTELNHVVLLAPPVGLTSGRRYFSEYPGAVRDEHNIMVIPRKDGTITHVADAFWDDAEKYFPPDAYSSYAKSHDLIIVEAAEENVVKHTENYELFKTTDHIQLLKLPGDHNFSGHARGELVRTVAQLVVD